jgi:hypothetical protein
MSTTDRPGLIQLTPAAARGELRILGQPAARAADERARLERRAKLLAWERLAPRRARDRARRRHRRLAEPHSQALSEQRFDGAHDPRPALPLAIRSRLAEIPVEPPSSITF